MPRRSARLMKLEQQKQEKKEQMEKMSGRSYPPVAECVLVTEDPYVTELKDEIVELRNQLVAKDQEIERLEAVKEPVNMDDLYESTLTKKNDKIVQLTRKLETVQKRLMDIVFICSTQD